MDSEVKKEHVGDNSVQNEQKIKEFLDKNLDAVYRFIKRTTGNDEIVDDIVQETFIKAWRNMERFDKMKNERTWLFTIAHNTMIDYFRKRKEIPFSMFENEEKENPLIETAVSEDPLPDQILEEKINSETLKRMLEKLSDEERELLTLYYEEDLNLREIAEIMNRSTNTIKSRHLRTINKLVKIAKELPSAPERENRPYN